MRDFIGSALFIVAMLLATGVVLLVAHGLVAILESVIGEKCKKCGLRGHVYRDGRYRKFCFNCCEFFTEDD